MNRSHFFVVLFGSILLSIFGSISPTFAGNILQSNYLMPTGNGGLDSSNGCYSLRQQNDGNLVLYHNKRRTALWDTKTYNRPVKHTIMQSDGNLVSYDTSGRPVWDSRTHGSGGQIAVLQDDGNFVIYAAGGRPVWATNTVSSCDTPSNPTPVQPQPPAPPQKQRLNLNVRYAPNIQPWQQALFTKAIQNWDRVITGDMVNQGPINIYVQMGNIAGSPWAETSANYQYTPRLRQARPDGYHAVITLKNGVANRLNSNLFVRLATHELGHALYLDDTKNDPSLGSDGIMHPTNLNERIPEGTFRKLEWFGYSVNRNAYIEWR